MKQNHDDVVAFRKATELEARYDRALADIEDGACLEECADRSGECFTCAAEIARRARAMEPYKTRESWR